MKTILLAALLLWAGFSQARSDEPPAPLLISYEFKNMSTDQQGYGDIELTPGATRLTMESVTSLRTIIENQLEKGGSDKYSIVILNIIRLDK
jgi:hypothetical protein